MSTLKKTHKNSKTGKYQPLTVGRVEKETGFKTNIASKSMKISTYFKNEGFAPLGEVLERVEHHLAK